MGNTKKMALSNIPAAEDAPVDALLTGAIDSASLALLRTVLHKICKDLPEAKASTRALLLIDDGDQINANGKRKLPTQRYETCEQCEKEFDNLKNSEQACDWHIGMFTSSVDTLFLVRG